MADELEEGEIMSGFTQAPHSVAKTETPSAAPSPTSFPKADQQRRGAADKVRMQALQFVTFARKRKADDEKICNKEKQERMTAVEIGVQKDEDEKIDSKETRKQLNSVEIGMKSIAIDFNEVHVQRQKAADEKIANMRMEQKLAQMQTWRESLRSDLARARQETNSKTRGQGALLSAEACVRREDPSSHRSIGRAVKIISEQRIQVTTDRHVKSGSQSLLQSQSSPGVATSRGALYILDGLNILTGCSRKDADLRQIPVDWSKLEEACHHYRGLYRDISVFLPKVADANFERLRGIFGDIFVECDSSAVGIQFMLNTVNIREGAHTFKLDQGGSFTGDEIKVSTASNQLPLCFLVTNECLKESACGFLNDSWVARHCIRFAFGPNGFAPL